MDTRGRNCNFDVRPGRNGDVVQFIFRTKDDASQFIKILNPSNSKRSPLLYEDIGDNGIVEEVKDKSFVVRLDNKTYDSLPRSLSGEVRQGRDRNRPLCQIVFKDKNQALYFESQLTLINIIPIKPEFKNSDGSLMYKEGDWINDGGVYFNKGDYIIRIDDENKNRLHALCHYFQTLSSCEQLKAIEQRCGEILTGFQSKAANLKTTKFTDKIGAIFNDGWMSNFKKINKIDETVKAIEKSFWWTTQDEQDFLGFYKKFNLKQMMEELVKKIKAIVININMMTCELWGTVAQQAEYIQNLEKVLETHTATQNTVTQQAIQGALQRQAEASEAERTYLYSIISAQSMTIQNQTNQSQATVEHYYSKGVPPSYSQNPYITFAVPQVNQGNSGPADTYQPYGLYQV